MGQDRRSTPMRAELVAARREAIERLAANVRYWRRRRHLTQAELAELVGVEPLTIRSIEGQRQRPRFTLLVDLATVLDIDVRKLFMKRPAAKRPRGRPRGS